MEVGGGGYGGGEGGVSGCWRTPWLPGKFSRMPPTGESEVGLNLPVSNSFSFKLHLLLSQVLLTPCSPQPPSLCPPLPIMHLLRACVSSNLCLSLQQCGSSDHVWSLLQGFHVWAGPTQTSLSPLPSRKDLPSSALYLPDLYSLMTANVNTMLKLFMH